MEKEVINNIYHLYRSHIVTTILLLLLGCVAVLVSIGVVKYKVIQSTVKRITLLVFAAVCSILLLVIQIISIVPIYKDYKEQSYIILENASITIKDGSTGTIDKTNRVVVIADGNEYELKMQTDYSLSTEKTYTGTIAYLKHSKYLVWYNFY